MSIDLVGMEDAPGDIAAAGKFSTGAVVPVARHTDTSRTGVVHVKHSYLLRQPSQVVRDDYFVVSFTSELAKLGV